MTKCNRVLQQQRSLYDAMFGDFSCQPVQAEECTLQEELDAFDEAIYLYGLFLEQALDRNDHSEVALLRKQLQEAKVGKRRLLTA